MPIRLPRVPWLFRCGEMHPLPGSCWGTAIRFDGYIFPERVPLLSRIVYCFIGVSVYGLSNAIHKTFFLYIVYL